MEGEKTANRPKEKKNRPFFFIVLFLFILLPTALSVYLYQEFLQLRLQMAELSNTVEQVSQRLEHMDSTIRDTVSEILENSGAAGDTKEDGHTLAAEEENTSNNGSTPEKEAGQTIYLTFDDGPSENTEKVLDILKGYQVKATFFVVGKEDAKSLELYQRIVREGHTLAMHSYTHDYTKVYASVDAFAEDFMKLRLLLYETTGVLPKFYRFPGGSSNSVSQVPVQEFITFLDEQSVTYFDWNAANSDALGQILPAAQLYENVKNSTKELKEAVVLMHDSIQYDTTVEALPGIIEYLQKQGASFEPITEQTTPVHHDIGE